MKLNFTLHIEESDKIIAKKFAKESLLMWDTSVTIDAAAEDSFEVLFTNNATEIRNAKKREHFEIVFLGNISEVQDIFENLYDIWPSVENANVRELRFKKLLKNLENMFEAYTYKSFLTTMIDSLPELIWFKDAIGAHMIVNNEFCKTVNKTKEDIRGRGHFYIWNISEEEYKKGEFVCMESEEDTMRAGHTCIFDEPLKTSEGMKQLKTYKSPLYNMFGKVCGTVGVAHDVTDFGNMGLELSILVENLPFPLMLCDNDLHVLKVNDLFKSLAQIDDVSKFDYTKWKQTKLTPVNKVVQVNNKINEQEYTIEINDKIHNIIITKQKIIDYFGNDSGAFIIFRDVSIERNYEQLILQDANTDALTGLYNRRYFIELANNYANKKITILYIDIDNFKMINDNFSHKRGDDILKHTATFMKELFAEGIIARIGGDEFIVMFEQKIIESDLKNKCEILSQKVRNLIRGNPKFQISISYGISESCEGKEIEEVVSEADSRMYEYKKMRHLER